MDLVIFATNILVDLFLVLIYLGMGIWISRKLKLSWNFVLWISAVFIILQTILNSFYIIPYFFINSDIMNQLYMSLPSLAVLVIFYVVIEESARYVSFKYIFKKLGIKPGKKSAVSLGSLWWTAAGLIIIITSTTSFLFMTFPSMHFDSYISDITGFQWQPQDNAAGNSTMNLINMKISNGGGMFSDEFLNEAFKFDILQLLARIVLEFPFLAMDIGLSLLIVASIGKGKKHLFIAAIIAHSMINFIGSVPNNIYATAALYAAYLAIAAVVLNYTSDLWKKGAVRIKNKFMGILEKWYE